jgi:predicted NUDIX family NTP pyrophosphohydrolase
MKQEPAKARERVSAGLLLFRWRDGQLEVCLAHPGGPLFASKDAGHWTIPKGQPDPGEELLAAAFREVEEEVGVQLERNQELIPLGSIQQKGGKVVHAWGVRVSDDDLPPVPSNLFEMEWPPGSGQQQQFPEIDQARFFSSAEARIKIKSTQIPLLDRLEEHLKAAG